jgi:hypothetical protein
MGERRAVYRFAMEKSAGTQPLGSPMRRWKDTIQMDLQEVEFGGVNRTEVAQDRDKWRKLLNVVMNFQVLYNSGTFLTSCKPVNFSKGLCSME